MSKLNKALDVPSTKVKNATSSSSDAKTEESRDTSSQLSTTKEQEGAQGSQTVQSLLDEYDTFIQKIKDTGNKVSSLSDMDKMLAVTDLTQEQMTLTAKYDELKDTELSATDAAALMNKSIDMLQEYNSLIAKLK